MNSIIDNVKKDMDKLIASWLEADVLRPNDIFVVGCSTSEVIGETIGTAGSEEVANIIFHHLQRLANEEQVFLAFQCCEHLNRALVIEREAAVKFGIEE